MSEETKGKISITTEVNKGGWEWVTIQHSNFVEDESPNFEMSTDSKGRKYIVLAPLKDYCETATIYEHEIETFQEMLDALKEYLK